MVEEGGNLICINGVGWEAGLLGTVVLSKS